jgi:cell division protein ZapA (FtsZ GTPase activity inhibitor)
LEQLVTIELFGQPYTFKTQSDINRAKEVADYLLQEVAKVERNQPNPSTSSNQLTIMILAALNITENYLDLKQERRRSTREVSNRAADLIRKLERCCVQSSPNNLYKLQTGR